MVTMNLVFLLVFLPALLLIMLLVDKEMRPYIFFLMYGCIAAYVSGLIHTSITTHWYIDEFYLSIHIAPVTEEFLKVFPIVLILFVSKIDRRTAIGYGILSGLGFSFFENACTLGRAAGTMYEFGSGELMFALSRGFGASVVHIACTSLLMYGISYCATKKKLAVTGTVAMFSLATLIHSLFNVLIQSSFVIAPFVLNVIVYILLLWLFWRLKKRDKNQTKA